MAARRNWQLSALNDPLPSLAEEESGRSSPPDDLLLHRQRVEPGTDSVRHCCSRIHSDVGNVYGDHAAMPCVRAALDEKFGVRRRQVGEQAAHGPLCRVRGCTNATGSSPA